MSESCNSNNKNRKKHVKGRDNIKVAVRCRPLLFGERSLSEIVCNTRKNQIGVVIPRARGRDSNKLYTFDKIYDTSTKQNDLFDHSIEPIITDVLSGYNCTIFAYGQTGSGKTFTMEGIRFDNHSHAQSNTELSNTDGIIPRAIKSIFYQLERDQIDSTVIVSHLEIYNEELTDLLCELELKKKKLTIYNDTKRSHGKCGVFVQGLEEIIVSSPQQIFDILCVSTSKRKTAATNLNNRSSRSHCIFTITIRIKTLINTEEIVKTGTLNLVDLAGSESIARSGADKINDRAKEAGHINTSLLTLGRVISALVERRQHIPYRESKLTRLLQESLGGRNKTLLIATISSVSPLEQTLSTLDYALRAKNIQNKPQLNVSMTKEKYVKELQVLINNYKRQIEALRNEKGIILPPKQYENMTKKLQEQKDDIEKMNALFEAEKNKLIEMNELFTKTNDKLNMELNEKNELIREMNELHNQLCAITNELNQNKFVVTQYANNEKILVSQAENVKNVLQNTINHRNILHDKIEQRCNIEYDNINNWHNKKNTIVTKLILIQNNLKCYKENSDSEFNKNLNYISDANNNVRNILQSIHSMHEFNDKNHSTKLVESQQWRQKYINNNLCETQLNEYINMHKNNNNQMNEKCNHVKINIVPNFIHNISDKMICLQTKLNALNENLKQMYEKQENQRDLFIENLNVCILNLCTEMNENENRQKVCLNEWKLSQENIINECKKKALDEINTIFNDITKKQIESFQCKYNNFRQTISRQNKQFNENHVNPLNNIINTYQKNQNQNNKNNNETSQKSIHHLNENVSNITNQTICDWSNKMNSNMNNLSETISNSYKTQNNYITNKIVNDLNIFNRKCTEYDKELINNKNIQNNNFTNIENDLNQNISSMNSYNNNINKYYTEQNKPYFNQLTNNLNHIKTECEQYQIHKYNKTGQTPTKQNVIYPTKFIETQPFENLVAQFNAENMSESREYSKTRSKSRSKSRSVNMSTYTKSKSSSPYFISDEIEINFTEMELGFRMYGGDKNKNCFIRHCTSDPRVCDNAQIVAIDGINVIDKSVGYIRTLLATKQRPISIKFKNQLENIINNCEDKSSFLVTDTINNNTYMEESDNKSFSTSKSSIKSSVYSSVNPRKRQRETGILHPKIHKLNYASPNKKRLKKSQITLSPISNVMDIDNISDLE